MFENAYVSLLASFVVGFVGAGLSAVVVLAVLRKEVELNHKNVMAQIEDNKKRLDESQAGFAEYQKRIEATFGRAVFRDACTGCAANKDERHKETLRRIEELEKAFRSCFEDLVSALKCDRVKA